MNILIVFVMNWDKMNFMLNYYGLWVFVVIREW